MCFDLIFPGSVSLQSSLQVSPAMKSLLPLAAAVALFLGLSAPAAAAGSPTKSHGTVGGWDIVSDSAGCAGSKVFANGTGLTFIFLFDGGTAISIGSEKWN